MGADRVLYFGCWLGETGHYLHVPGGQWPRTDEAPEPLTNELGRNLDGYFCPKGKQVEGKAKITFQEGWTVMAFWDRSADQRGNSHSTYVANGRRSFDEMCQLAVKHFPRIWKRSTDKFKVTFTPS